jgi:hypothetical protein
MRNRLADSEGIIRCDCRLLFFYAADVGPARSTIEQAGENRELGCGADSVNFDAAVIEVAGVAGESEFDGGALGEVAIADPLDTATDIPAPGYLRFTLWFSHRGQMIV